MIRVPMKAARSAPRSDPEKSHADFGLTGHRVQCGSPIISERGTTVIRVHYRQVDWVMSVLITTPQIVQDLFAHSWMPALSYKPIFDPW